MIMDLLKTAKFALDGIEVSIDSTRNAERYVGNLLRIIEMRPIGRGRITGHTL